MDKAFQLAILKECARRYPGHALASWQTLVDMAPGDSPEEKTAALTAHLTALQEFGYIAGFVHGFSSDGSVKINHAFRITGQGLLAAGEDVLHPVPHRELCETLLAQIQAVRSLSPQEKQSLRTVLYSLPQVALKRLLDKGVDALLALVLP